MSQTPLLHVLLTINVDILKNGVVVGQSLLIGRNLSTLLNHDLQVWYCNLLHMYNKLLLLHCPIS